MPLQSLKEFISNTFFSLKQTYRRFRGMPIQFKSSQILHALIAADYDFAVFIVSLNASNPESETARVKIKLCGNTIIKLSQAGKSFQVAENGNPPNFSLKTFDVLNNNASFNTCPAGYSYQWI